MEQDVADQGTYKTIFSRDELDLIDRIMHCSSDGKSLLYAM